MKAEHFILSKVIDGFKCQFKDFAINLVGAREPCRHEQEIGQTSEQEDTTGEKHLNDNLVIAWMLGKNKNILILGQLKRKMSLLKVILNNKSIFLTIYYYL